jgi:hypothetical protein
VNISKILVIFVLPLFLFAWKMESGTVTIPAATLGSSTWQTIDLNQTYDVTPLVFTLVDEGSGHSGDSPVIIRIKNVTTTSFEMVQVESQSVVESIANQGPHPSVNVHYIVIEPGDYTLEDGTRLLAGLRSTTTKQGKNVPNPRGFDTINFSPSFSVVPVVLGMVQGTENETSTLPGAASSPWLTQTIRNVGTNSFQMALERAETSAGSININENIGYLAIDANIQSSFFDVNTCEVIDFETIRTSDSIRGWQTTCTGFNFANTYASNPNVIGSQNSRDGADGGWLRRCALNTTSVSLNIDEDQAQNSERAQTTEIAGLAIFEKDFAFDSSKTIKCKTLVSEYREDECYWLGSSSVDIIESKNGNNAIAMNSADTIQPVATANYAGLCRAGNFNGTRYADVDVAFTLGTQWTLSTWVEFPLSNTGQQYHILGSYTGVGDLPLFDFGSFPDIKWGIYDNGGAFTTADFNDTLTGWHQLTFVNTMGQTNLYLDGVFHSNIALSTSGTLTVLNTSTDGFNTQTLSGNTDELKIWGTTLSAEEINNLYIDEKAGNTYDGTPRVCPTCDANATAGIWGLIGIPADFRTATNKDVADVFDEFPAVDYNLPANPNGWVVFKRNYSSIDNSSSYSVVPYTGTALEFGQGYWLATQATVSWSENTLPNVDYNSSNPACTASKCVEIDLTSVTKDFAIDGNDGSGKNRNNMLGFIGHTPVDWADCRFLIDGIVYTPSGAESAGYLDKQVWQYNPGTLGTNANGYTTCDDVTPGTCKLEPYKGFWVILHGITKNKTVKLLIPQE